MNTANISDSSLAEIPNPFAGVDFSALERSLRRPRTLLDFCLTGLVTAMTLLALVPLFSVVIMLLWRGGQRLSLAIFTQLPPAPLEQGGGFGNAILGTLFIVGLAVLMSVPVGLLSAIYIAQAKESRLAQMVQFSAKVLTGFPSILAGVFAYGAIVLTTGGYSAIAGAVALSILMLPTIILTAEDAIRMVPSKMKEAAIGMGATHTQTVWMVLLPTAIPGILTGVMLSVARARGRNRATALYRAVQQLLAVVARPGGTDAAYRITGRADLQLCQHAISKPSGVGLGGGFGAGVTRARCKFDRPESVVTTDTADLGEITNGNRPYFPTTASRPPASPRARRT